jgi:hypothetical protein
MLAIGVSVAGAQDTVTPSVVTVFSNEHTTLSVPGVTRVVALDETVCHVDMAGGEIRFSGRLVGETVVFAWIGEVRSSLLVRVTQKPDPPRAATLSPRSMDAIGRGRAGLSVMSTGGAATPFVTHEYWEWQRVHDGARLSVRGFANTYSGGPHAFNLPSLSIEHASPTRTLSLMDFTLNLGAAGERATSLSSYGGFGVRGVDYAVTRGPNRVEFFAGSTVPAFFLSFAGTRNIAGAKLDRAVSQTLKLFSTVGAVMAPVGSDASSARAIMPFHTTGMVYGPSPAFSAKATVGVSTRGVLGDVQAEFVRGRFTASAAASDASSTFPLNRVQLLTAGESSVRGIGSWAWSHVSLTTAARHTVSKPGGLALLSGTSNSLSQNVQVNLPYRQQVSANLTRHTSSSAVLASNANSRIDGSWSTPLGSRLSNTLQAGVGRNSDITQVNSYQEGSIRNAINLALPFGDLFATFEHQRLDPSLLGRVRQVIDTMPADARELFSIDPALFLATVDLPPDVRRLLETAEPSSTSISLGGQFSRGTLAISPSISIMTDAPDTSSARRSVILGYSATWQLTPTWQLRSALTNRLFYDGSALAFRRGNVVTIGLDKSFTGLPRWLAPMTTRAAIQGRVFRDSAVNGVFDADDPGMPGVRVRLDDQRLITTDSKGYFRFDKVTPGLHRVSIDIAQFPAPVRVTTPSDVAVEAIDRTTEVNFGIVNFSRVIGTVFADYHNDDQRQNDAAGLPNIRVRITGDTMSTVVTSDRAGDYEAANLPPGAYTITIASEDLPAGYVVSNGPRHLHVEPVATAVIDLPVRALRSISGRVLLKRGSDQSPTLEPVAGVTITAGNVTATTDAQGRYALRELPAGLVELRVVAVRDVPQQLQVPRGVVRLSTEPMQLENANIVIANADLIDYVTAARTNAESTSASPPR